MQWRESTSCFLSILSGIASKTESFGPGQRHLESFQVFFLHLIFFLFLLLFILYNLLRWRTKLSESPAMLETCKTSRKIMPRKRHFLASSEFWKWKASERLHAVATLPITRVVWARGCCTPREKSPSLRETKAQ